MAEYIEREALLKRLKFKVETDTTYNHVKSRGLASAMAQVRKAPASDVVEVKRGRWVQVIYHVEFEDGFVDRLCECCSRCHEPNGRRTSDFCPNCGADMREDGDG